MPNFTEILLVVSKIKYMNRHRYERNASCAQNKYYGATAIKLTFLLPNESHLNHAEEYLNTD
jgi:hypothetical protein